MIKIIVSCPKQKEKISCDFAEFPRFENLHNRQLIDKEINF